MKRRVSAIQRTSVAWLLAAIGLLSISCSGTSPPSPMTTRGEPAIESPVSAADVADSEPSSEAEPAIAASPAAAYLADEAALTRGRGVFRAACTGYCHTSGGTRRVAPDLFDCDWTHGDTDDEIYKVVFDGVPETQMLGFGGKMSDEDLWKIIAYLRKQSRCV